MSLKNCFVCLYISFLESGFRCDRFGIDDFIEGFPFDCYMPCCSPSFIKALEHDHYLKGIFIEKDCQLSKDFILEDTHVYKAFKKKYVELEVVLP